MIINKQRPGVRNTPRGGIRTASRRAALALAAAGLIPFVAATSAPDFPDNASPATPRELFNSGTKKLREGKLPEAESLFESALASQDDQWQPPALYNLGQVRFQRGVEELKKGPSANSALARGQAAMRDGSEALREADDALGGDDLGKLVGAYMHGRGARKELKAATAAVKQALDAHRATLMHWQRSSEDFKGTAELDSADKDAPFNADVVDRSIAKLVDSLRQLQQSAAAMGNMSRDLGEKLKKLKGRIPDKDAPPGGGGDDDDDEDQPFGKQPAEKEGASKEGEQMTFSQEQAGWLLDGYKLGGDRRLPMGEGEPGEPRIRNGRTW